MTDIRKQTLANAERYITPELKELESKIVGAEERLLKLEREIFASVREEVGEFIPRILASARAAAEIDMCAGFAEVAGALQVHASQDSRACGHADIRRQASGARGQAGKVEGGSERHSDLQRRCQTDNNNWAEHGR